MSNDVKEESVADLSNDEAANGVCSKFFVKVKIWAKGVWFAVLGKRTFPSFNQNFSVNTGDLTETF